MKNYNKNMDMSYEDYSRVMREMKYEAMKYNKAVIVTQEQMRAADKVRLPPVTDEDIEAARAALKELT